MVDAGIPMRDLVASCAAGKWKGKLVLDLDDEEDKIGEADVPVAYMPKLDKVTLLQMDGILPTKDGENTIKLAIEGCKQIYEVQREALKKKYGPITEELEEEPEEELEEEPEEELEEEPEEELEEEAE
jgi:exosome complex component RRP41